MKSHLHLLCLTFLLIASLAACSPASQAAATPTAVEPGFTPWVASATPASQPAQPTRQAPTAAAAPRPVLIDSDMAGDDWMAILYLLQRTDIAVKAITVAGTGESHCAPGIKNATGLVALAGRAPIPAACGRETPLSGAHVFPQSWRSSADSLGGLSVPAGQNPLSSPISAPALLAQLLQASPQKMTLLATGPLTNLGELFQASPGIQDKIAAIYIMGGAVHVPGNLGIAGNTAAEWNIYVDPQAANIVFASGVPVILVPLDATNHNPATPAFYKKLQASALTPEATFVYDLFTKNRSYQSGSFYFWDPTAAALLADESLGTYEDDPLCVVEAEGSTSGQTLVKAGCPTVRVAISADSARFEQVFLDTLNNP